MGPKHIQIMSRGLPFLVLLFTPRLALLAGPYQQEATFSQPLTKPQSQSNMRGHTDECLDSCHADPQ